MTPWRNKTEDVPRTGSPQIALEGTLMDVEIAPRPSVTNLLEKAAPTHQDLLALTVAGTHQDPLALTVAGQRMSKDHQVGIYQPDPV